jgi:hypothetical protein
MNKTYIGSHGSQIIVVNGIVTATASPEHCPVGKKPNMDFIRRCGFRAPKAVKQYFVGPLADGKGNRING